MTGFRVDEDRCIQCGECAADCPADVIEIEDGSPKMVNENGCLRCLHCFTVCPVGAVSILGFDPDKSVDLSGNLPDPKQLENLIKGRRSVRRYTGNDLPADLIDELLEIAWHAPTGVNSQSVLFTVVRERSVMDRLREEVMTKLSEKQVAGMLPDGFAGQYLAMAIAAWQEEEKDVIFRGAPHLILASAPKTSPCPVQDTHIALTTFQLMAHAKGVGTVWDGMVMMSLAVCPELIERLGIPEDHTIGYAIVFGEPAVEYHRTVQRGPALVNLVR